MAVERIEVRELRQHASRYLSRVKAGETVEVTERGELVALLVPLAPRSAPGTGLAPTVAWFRRPRPFSLPRRVPAPPGTASASDDLRADR